MDQLIGSDLHDAQKGYWYKALVYLKAENLAKCKEELQRIINNRYYNHQLATNLLGALSTALPGRPGKN